MQGTVHDSKRRPTRSRPKSGAPARALESFPVLGKTRLYLRPKLDMELSAAWLHFRFLERGLSAATRKKRSGACGWAFLPSRKTTLRQYFVSANP
jgi:hypothetical protein